MVKKRIFIIAAFIVLLMIAGIGLTLNRNNDDGTGNVTVNNTKLDYESDPVFDKYPKMTNNPNLADGTFWMLLGYDGDRKAEFVIDTVGIHEIPFDQWIQFNNKNVTVELNDGDSKLLTVKKIDAGMYNRFYILLRSAKIFDNGSWHEADILNDRLMVEGDFIEIDKDLDTSFKIDIISDKSFFKTEDGKYIFAPHVKITSYKKATIEESAPNYLVTNGTLWTKVFVGTDINGKFSVGRYINGSRTIVSNGTSYAYLE